jgi:hypothetical protein
MYCYPIPRRQATSGLAFRTSQQRDLISLSQMVRKKIAGIGSELDFFFIVDSLIFLLTGVYGFAKFILK